MSSINNFFSAICQGLAGAHAAEPLIGMSPEKTIWHGRNKQTGPGPGKS